MPKPAAVTFANTAHVRDHCMCLHLQRAARSVARDFDDALRPAGLTNGQFSLMMSLNRPEAARMGEISALLGMDRTTLTASLKPLERRKWVKVAVDPGDRRGRRVTLTSAGHKALAEALPLWRRTHARIERLVSAGADRMRAQLRTLST